MLNSARQISHCLYFSTFLTSYVFTLCHSWAHMSTHLPLTPKIYQNKEANQFLFVHSSPIYKKKPPPNNPSSSTPSKILHVHLHPPQNSPNWSTPLPQKTTGSEISPSIFQGILALSKKELHLFKHNIHLCLKRINWLIQVVCFLNT